MEKEVSVKENEGGEGSKEVAAVPLKDVRAEGLGELAKLPDFLLLVILFSLEPKELLTLSLVSKSMYVLCGDEEMWKQRCHDHWEKGEIKFKGFVSFPSFFLFLSFLSPLSSYPFFFFHKKKKKVLGK